MAEFDHRLAHRKIIVPWYDSEAVCYGVIALMAAVLLFGALGLSTAGEVAEHRGYIWVPAALILMSLAVTISTTTRLVRRFLRRYPR